MTNIFNYGNILHHLENDRKQTVRSFFLCNDYIHTSIFSVTKPTKTKVYAAALELLSAFEQLSKDLRCISKDFRWDAAVLTDAQTLLCHQIGDFLNEI